MSRSLHKLKALLPAGEGFLKGPADDGDDRRIEVAVTHEPDGRRQVVMRDLSYGPGIGWYAQKTIRLDPEQVDALMRELCCCKQLVLPSRGTTKPRPGREAQIISFDIHSPGA